MSEAIQLEQVLNEKAGIEEESQELDQEQKMLRQKAKVLAEKIVQEMKKRNNAKQDTVNKLQSQVSQLETQLNTLANTPILDDNDLPENENNEGEEAAASEAFDESMAETEDTVSVTAVDDEEIDEVAKQDKKKRKLF
jgi:hypothetical protein